MNDQTTEDVNEPVLANDERPIVIFGGTFDPPHRRHVEIAQGVDALLKAKQLLVIPAWQNPQRTTGPIASSAHRLAMCTLAFSDLADTVVLPIETARAAPSYTIDTVRAVHAMQETGEIMKGPLRLVVGSDQAINFRSWKDWADLTSLATPVVVLRPPHTRADWTALLAEQMDEAWAARWLSWTLPIEPVNASSTEVRRRIAAGETTDDLLLPAVANYIKSSGLYVQTA
ncbi:MAG: nicotinate (nicotinamide) nucleotide adenylyltransferase [Planctomycetota bacterium]|nr:nicotinate (nicotinamide) nucleotide adenylyltransferase [Planctomycetota bacterium]